MTLEEANALEEWIKDHDTRYLAKAKTDADRCYVLLTRPEDGTELDPIYDIEAYAARHIEGDDPGPTIHGAWQRWASSRLGSRG